MPAGEKMNDFALKGLVPANGFGGIRSAKFRLTAILCQKDLFVSLGFPVSRQSITQSVQTDVTAELI